MTSSTRAAARCSTSRALAYEIVASASSSDFHRQAVIPSRVLERAPSAELRPDQTDQDSLPPYEVVDAVVER